MIPPQPGGKLFPDTEQQQHSTKLFNLTVFQRIDPFVEKILAIAPNVTLYRLNLDLHQWSRKDVEGTLFVVQRNDQPRFQFIVMNRLNTDNLVEGLLGDFEYDVQLPYLLYRNAAQEVNGIWFYNERDCEAVADLFSRILNAYPKVSPKPIVSSTKSEVEEAVPTSALMEGPLEPPTSSASTVPDVSNDQFVNFFTASKINGNTPNAAITGQSHQSSAAVPMSSFIPNVIPFPFPTQQPAPPLPTPSTPLMLPFGTIESSNSSRATNLLKPSFFESQPSLMMPPIPSSTSAAPPLHPPLTMQRPYGTPLLQPFPPPTPSPSLAPIAYNAPVFSRDRVRDALLRLVQNNQFIDMVYREMLNTYYP